MKEQRSLLWETMRARGEPTVRGGVIRTSVIYKRWDAGETYAALARDLDLSIEQVVAAVHYELGRRARNRPLKHDRALAESEEP